MAVSETQLDTWSKQGSVNQSKNTYATIKSALESSDAPYNDRSYSIFLQGSYGNDTNIYADSDVDLVIATDSVYYSDTSSMEPDQLAIFQSRFSLSQYQYADFKRDVISQLLKKFGGDVNVGKKAIRVDANASRRDADVLPAAEYRRYTGSGQNYHTGIVFWTTDGVEIVNFPKQHSSNCTLKHQNTNGWFKPCVRVLKNMRNKMIAEGRLSPDIAPSYFLEGMLYNVPNGTFGTSYVSSIAGALNWLYNCERSKLVCANERYFLLNATSPVTWRAEKMQMYLDQTIKYWNA